MVLARLIFATASLFALASCAHHYESNDMSSSDALIFSHEIKHIGAAP